MIICDLQHAFEVDFTDPNDDLLDWEQYSKSRSIQLFGKEWTFTPPAWWFTLTRGQRRAALSTLCCSLSFVTIVLLLILINAAVGGIQGWTFKDISESACSWNDWRLPQAIRPNNYNITFEIDMKDPWQVYGSADIEIILGHASRCIVLHASGPLIENEILASNINSNANSPVRANIKIVEDMEQMILEWDERIPKGPAILRFSFQYKLSNSLSGLYLSKHEMDDGTFNYLAVTQFEANSARKAFPCFDEPEMKAQFQIEVRTNQGLTVLSNMPARTVHHHDHDTDDLITWHFSPTPPMSTYLVVIIIGNLTSVEREIPPSIMPWPSVDSIAMAHAALNADTDIQQITQNKEKNKNGDSMEAVVTGDKIVTFSPPTTFNETNTRKLSVWGVGDKVQQLEFAADAAAKVLPAYEAVLNVPYALPKLDLVSILILYLNFLSVLAGISSYCDLEKGYGYVFFNWCRFFCFFHFMSEVKFGVKSFLFLWAQVAIPDFSAGAMENWGCITYREAALLVSSSSSLKDLRYVTQIIAHEIAHQWFGNLVTMEWWSELWLNEGFASYFEYYGASAAHPSLSFFDRFFSQDMPAAFKFDSQKTSRPMSMSSLKVNSTDVIESMFDKIAYERGSAIIRMLRAWLNKDFITSVVSDWEEAPSMGYNISDIVSDTTMKDPFFLGLHTYLAANSLNTSTASKLWKSMSSASSVDIQAIMEDWTYHQGFPLVTVTLDAKRNVWLQQSPFSSDGLGHCQPAVGAAWWIPVAFISSEAPTTIKWTEMNACQSLRPLMTLPKDGWVKLNANQYGYYRVDYQSDLWNSLIVAAGEVDKSGVSILSGIDLSGLLDDTFALAQANQIKIDLFLRFVETLPQFPSSEDAPWAVVLPKLEQIQQLVPCIDDWQSWVKDEILESFVENMNAKNLQNEDSTIQMSFFWSNSTGNLSLQISTMDNVDSGGMLAGIPIGFRMLWPSILKTAGLLGDQSLIKEATDMLGQPSVLYSKNLDPDLRSALYQTAAKFSSEPKKTFDTLKQLFLDANDVDERDRLLQSLAYSPMAVLDGLEFVLSDSVRSQDVRSFVIAAAKANGAERMREVWDWFRDETNWNKLHNKLGADKEASRRMGQILENIASGLASEEAKQEVEALYSSHMYNQSDRSYSARAIESIESNIRWIDAHADDICSWVKQS